jgi:dUTP pyrophosphatase
MKDPSSYLFTSYYIYPRSSISKTPLIMHNSVGIIDSLYRNTLKVAVYNLSDNDYSVKKGEKLFQICAPYLQNISRVNLVKELSESDRGSGFGSSNLKSN